MNIGTQDAYLRSDPVSRRRTKSRMRRSVALVFLGLMVQGFPVEAEPLNYERRTPVVNVVEKISPSVVTMKTDVRRKVRVDPFENMGFAPFFRPNWVQERTFSSAGSGFIVDHKGTVITNAHVVADANRLTCITQDGDERSLTLIGVDNDFDVAVLQIDPDEGVSIDYADIDWGNTRDLMIGETLVVIGSALSFQNSVSVGVVSAVERSIEVPNREEPYFGMIQTDAAINRGNSGGPMVNVRGELIGLTTLIATEGGGSDGIGFAIPAERVSSVYNEFVHGIVSLEERLGILLVNPKIVDGVDQSQMQRLGLTKNRVEGLVVVKQHPSGLGIQHGLREGDLLIEVDGRSVVRRNDLQRVLEEHDLRQPLAMVALRLTPQTGEVTRATIKVPAGELEGSDKIEQIDSWYGFEVSGISNDVADRMGVAIDDGVVIRRILAGSPAENAGLAPGDLIQAIGGYQIQTVGDFRRLRKVGKNEATVNFKIRRGNAIADIALTQPSGNARR